MDGVEPLETVDDRLDELTDLFRRRLLDDREKQRAFDALYAELKQTRKFAEGEWIRPIARRLFAVIDRLDSEATDFARSIAEELIALLETYDFQGIESDAGTFDPTRQEVGLTIVDDAQPTGAITRQLRRGWLQGDHVVRPMLVEVVRDTGSAAPDDVRET